MTTADSAGSRTPASDPEALREDIERTREQLGETVEALVAKTDVKARAQQKAVEAVSQVRQQTSKLKSRLPGQLDPRVPGLAAAAFAVLVAGWLLARRGRRAG